MSRLILIYVLAELVFYEIRLQCTTSTCTKYCNSVGWRKVKCLVVLVKQITLPEIVATWNPIVNYVFSIWNDLYFNWQSAYIVYSV